MAQRTIINSTAGATLAISASLPATYDAAGYGATTITYTAVGEVENFGQHGVTATVTEFTPIDTSIVTKVKGSKNYGTKSLTLGSIPGNAGQVILKAASESNNRYSVKITYPDTSIHYMDVLVSKYEQVDGAVNDIQKINCDFAICRLPVIVPQA
jgi:hypothetical protein